MTQMQFDELAAIMDLRMGTIRQIVKEVLESNPLPISAWDKDYMCFIDALHDIAYIAAGGEE
jgi:hypothetical protein